MKVGYIDKESISIIERSIGKINSQQLNGNIQFNVRYRALVCNPPKGTIISCKVLNINKMGVLVEKKPLSIVCARQHHEDKSVFKTIDIGDEINVILIGNTFDLYDEEICSIGIIHNE